MKRMKHILFVFFIALLIAFSVGMQFYPEEISKFVGFRFYVVLTGSMEPTIPTYSLVFSKTINEDAEVNSNTIITFKIDNDGKESLLTHYYRDTIEENGKTYYRTQPEGVKDQFDPYQTTREDIIGKYIFHIPYVGKMFLFLQSQFGVILYAEWGIIWLINKTVKAIWKEKEESKNESGETTI